MSYERDCFVLPNTRFVISCSKFCLFLGYRVQAKKLTKEWELLVEIMRLLDTPL